jgi:hypothetical protein
MSAVESRHILGAAYGALLPHVSDLDEAAAWEPTRCTGWVARDLVSHLLSDARRGLVALHTPSAAPADVDAVTYWHAWQPEPPGDDIGRRSTRVEASLWTSARPIGTCFAETARALLVAAGERDGTERVATQGHVLTVADLCSTLAVEATVHHMDLRLGAPSREGLSETRRVLDGLLGASFSSRTTCATRSSRRAVSRPTTGS